MSRDVEFDRHIEKLSEGIGPRPAASAAERAAADYVSLEMEQFASEVAVETYGGLTTFVWMYLTLFVLALLANLTFFTNPSLAFVASLAVIVFLNQEVNAKGFFFEFFPKRDSKNVVGVIEPAAQAKRRVIISASMDSGRDGLLFRPNLRRYFRGIFQFFVAFLILQVSFSLLALFVGPQPYILVSVRIIGLVELVACIGLLVHQFTGAYMPGANDNASGVAALLEVGKRLSEERLPDTEVWLVATGGGRSVQSGALAFLRRHWNEVRGDWFITLDHVGAGKLAYTLGEGLLKLYAVDHELVEYARTAAAVDPEWEVGETVNRIEPTDLVPLLAMGLRAIGVRAGADDGFGVAAHTREDTPDVIEDSVIEHAIDFTVELAGIIGTPAVEEEEAEAEDDDDSVADESMTGPDSAADDADSAEPPSEKPEK